MNRIITKDILPSSIKKTNEMGVNICDLISFLKKETKIDITSNKEFVQSY